nr:hypothetical protein [Tanacetum cinerariifolium]
METWIGSTASSSSTYNVAFVSSNSTNSTNEVSIAYGVSTSSGHNSQKEVLHHTLMISCALSLLIKPVVYSWIMRTLNRSKGNQESRRRDAGNTRYKAKDNRRPAKQDEHKAMVTIDGEGVEWTGHVKDDTKNYALIAFNSSNLGSNTEVTSCSKVCEESYAKLKKLYDEQREQLGVASIEIQAYTLALKKKLLSKAEKEKEELKTKLANFQSSSKGLSKLRNSHMSAKDKSRLGYGTQIHEGVLFYENEVLKSVFDSRSINVKDSPVNDRFAKFEGMHAVPPPMTRIYMPPKFDFVIDESKFTYGPKQSKTSESDVKTNDLASCESNSSVETLESMPKPVESKPKAVSEPKVWFDAPIIEEYESDSDDEYMFKALVEQEKPSCAFINTVKHVKTPMLTVKDQDISTHHPKVHKRDWTGLMPKRLGLRYGYTRKACFVCGSFSHLIRDCDFHEKRMAKQVELNKSKNKDNPHHTLKGKGIVDSGCSRHMTGNKSYLVEYQDFNGGPIAFGGSKGQITVMSSDSHANITYTLMSSYDLTVNGYFGMPMDPLDPYAQLVMEAPPSHDYIPGPEAPPLPDYIPGPEYPEYLPPADDVFLAEEQPLPTTVSTTAESPRYITDSKPEMDPEEENGDNEKSEGDSIDYSTSRGDAAADDDDLSEDDVDDEDEEESSDSEEEEEEHLALTVLASALHNSEPEMDPEEEDGDDEKSKGDSIDYSTSRGDDDVADDGDDLSEDDADDEDEEESSDTPLSRTPPIRTPSMLPIPLPTLSFPLPLLLPSTSCREGIPKADMPLRKRARFTTLTGGYEVGECFVAAARQIRHALTVDDSCKADDGLIGRLRRERRYFRTMSTTYAREVAHSHAYCTQIMDYC